MNFPVEHPIYYYAALSAAMSACLYLFATVRRDLQGLRKKLEGRLALADTEAGRQAAHLAALETRLGEWAGRTKELEEKIEILAGARRSHAAAGGIDANQRTHVLRLARRGDRAEQIAAEMGIPRNEVDLLVKVQRAVVRTF